MCVCTQDTGRKTTRKEVDGLPRLVESAADWAPAFIFPKNDMFYKEADHKEIHEDEIEKLVVIISVCPLHATERVKLVQKSTNRKKDVLLSVLILGTFQLNRTIADRQ